MTLYILRVDRPPAVAADSVAAARWASAQSCRIMLVTPKDETTHYDGCGADLVVASEAESGFQFYDGLRQAIDKGEQFEQVICACVDTAFLRPGIDTWFGERFYQENASLVGVADRHHYSESFIPLASRFAEWGLPHEAWDRPPNTPAIHSAVFGLTKKLARELFYRRLLLPAGYATWPLPFGVYATWTCQMLMQTVVLRGSMDRPQPPLYVNDGWGGAYNPPPYLLHSGVMLYWSIRRVAGFSETETRTWCQTVRQPANAT